MGDGQKVEEFTRSSMGKISGVRWNKRRAGLPWWVEEIDSPRLAIDDKVYKRYDQSRNVLEAFERYIGEKKYKDLLRVQREVIAEHCRRELIGYRLEDRALEDASWLLERTGDLNKGFRSWKRMFVETPKERGVRRYEGSPEEAARLVKAAARYFGAATVGITLLDRRHIHARERGMDIVFEDVDEPYEEPGRKIVIPEKCKYAIALAIQMPYANIKRCPSVIGDVGTSLAYSRCEFLVGALAEFIRGLGYVAIPSVNDLGSSVAIAVDAGLGELGRNNLLITPEYGPMVRLAKVITDLPMACDKPISFGVLEFCKECKLCAEACPPKAISMKDEPDFEVVGEWNNPGHQAWFENGVSCYAYWHMSGSYCSLCLSVCPWTKKDTFFHSVVKATIAKTTLFNKFFILMDKLFYGKRRDPAKWWRMNLPEYGIDSPKRKF